MPRPRGKEVALPPAKKRRLKWTCRYCGHGFNTWTRRGLHVTCPKCHRIQEGPEGLRRLLPETEAPKPRARKPKVVAIVKAKTKLVALPKKPSVVKKAPPSAPVARAEPALSPAAAGPERGIFSRLIFGG